MSGVVSAISIGVAAGVGATALGATAVTAGLIGAGVGIAGGLASGMLGDDSSNQTINLPDVNTVINPAAQSALASRTDTGATVKLGSTVKDQRVSGSRTSSGSTKSSTVDILGGLGGGGLSV